MELPKAAALVPLVLEELNRGPAPVQILKLTLARRFGLGESEITQAFLSGSNQTFENRFNPALKYLRHARLIEKQSKRGGYCLTERGKAVLEGSIEIDYVLFEKRFEPTFRMWADPVPEPRGVKPSETSAENVRINALAASMARPILAKLGKMPLKTLYGLFLNAERVADNPASPPEKRMAAMMVYDEIHRERERRASSNNLSAYAEDSFRWPSTDVRLGGSGLEFEAEDEGMLARMGYHVGRTRGEAPYIRRRLLTEMFLGQLPGEAGDGYFAAWGQPDTGTRLRKLAETIAAMARNAKRRRDRMDAAISDWEGDLAFLRERFYVGRFDFPWPKTSVLEQVEEAVPMPVIR